MEIEMENPEPMDELLAFFKALADQNRLKIVGLLSDQSRTVEELAEMLGVSVSTTSHHLSRLAKAGLVSASPEGHYYRYSIQTDFLQDMSQRILRKDVLPSIHRQQQPLTFEERVLKTFTDADGRILAFPKQEKKFAVLLAHAFTPFEKNRIYTGQEVEEILQRFNDDTATLRRAMIEYRWMDRSKDGTQYWVMTQS
jgi:predicted transcriptional regulator